MWKGLYYTSAYSAKTCDYQVFLVMCKPVGCFHAQYCDVLHECITPYGERFRECKDVCSPLYSAASVVTIEMQGGVSAQGLSSRGSGLGAAYIAIGGCIDVLCRPHASQSEGIFHCLNRTKKMRSGFWLADPWGSLCSKCLWIRIRLFIPSCSCCLLYIPWVFYVAVSYSFIML